MRSKKEIVRRKELSRMHAKLWKLFRALHGPHSWIPSDVSTALETYRTRARGRRERESVLSLILLPPSLFKDERGFNSFEKISILLYQEERR